MEKFFKLQEHGTNVKTEVIAGITTFFTMAYILAVNPSILGDAGLDNGAVFVATALASVIGTVLMALLANMPFALAPGMGLNAFFAYTVVLGMGYSPQFALAAVFVEGVIFMILSVTNVRTAIFNAIPNELKIAVGAGIGAFIFFIGLQNSGIVGDNAATLVSPGAWSAPVVLALIGFIIVIILMIKNVKGALLIAILATWVLGIIAQLAGLYQVDPAVGNYSLIPSAIISMPPSIAPTFAQCFAFGEIFSSASSIFSFITVMFAFLFVDCFDTIGTVMGVATKANMLKEDGTLPKSGEILLADAIATTAGAVLGTSTTTTYVESAAGVSEGGRTGLTALVVAAGFALSLLFAPLFLTIPAFATACALMAVGILMFEPLRKLDMGKMEVLIPVAVTVFTMPLFYSISDGLIYGVLSWTVVKIAGGKARDVSALVWVLDILFILKLVLI